MNSRRRTVSRLAALLFAMILVISSQMTVFAEQSDDNSLSSLGIETQGVTVSPDFEYDHLNYDVVVPAGTTELQLSPVLSNPDATINSIDGTTLDNGNGTVTITITAPSGAMTAYTLHVTAAADTANVDPAEAIAKNESQSEGTQPASAAEADVASKQADAAAQKKAEKQSESQAESESEDSRYVKVDKNTLQDAENTITRLQKDLQVYKDRSHTFTYVIYGLIAGCVILLFLVVNLAIRRKDLASELKAYKKAPRFAADFDDYGDVIPEDGWLDDDPKEKPSRKKKKDRKAQEVPQYDDSDDFIPAAPAVRQDGRVNAQTSWTKQHVGTPVEPSKEYVPYDGYARSGEQAHRGNVRSGYGTRAPQGQSRPAQSQGRVSAQGQSRPAAQSQGRPAQSQGRPAQGSYGASAPQGQNRPTAQSQGRPAQSQVSQPQGQSRPAVQSQVGQLQGQSRPAVQSQVGQLQGQSRPAVQSQPQSSSVSDETRVYRPAQPSGQKPEASAGTASAAAPSERKLTRAEKAAERKLAKEEKKALQAEKESRWKNGKPDMGDAVQAPYDLGKVAPASSEVKTSDMPDVKKSDPYQNYRSTTPQPDSFSQTPGEGNGAGNDVKVDLIDL